MSTRLEEIARRENIESYVAGAFSTAAASEIEFIAPTVPCGSLLVNVASYDRRAPFRIPDTKRANGGDAVKLEFGGTTENAALETHGADASIDLVYSTGGPAGVTTRSDQELIVDLQSAGLMAATACATGRFDRVLTAVSTAAGSAVEIDVSDAAIDVVDLIDEQIEEIIKSIGGASPVMEIRMLWGMTALRLARKHASVKSRVSGGATKASPANVTVDTFNGMTIVPTVGRVSTAVVETSKPGAASESRSFMLSNRLYVFAASQVPTRMDPSAIKLLQLGNSPLTPRYYTRPDGRVETAAFDWAEKVHVGNAGAIVAIDLVTGS